MNECAAIVLIEPIGRLRERLERVLRSATDRPVVSLPLEDLQAVADWEPELVVCGAQSVPDLLPIFRSDLPFSQLCVHNQAVSLPLFNLALGEARISNLIGWGESRSSPRPWELLMVARKLIEPGTEGLGLASVLAWGAQRALFRPQTSAELLSAVEEASVLALRAGACKRLADRIGLASHEVLMNAMYDAPVDERGQARFAHDRKSAISLTAEEAPTFEIGHDGMHLAIRIVDPFGELRRHHVFEGVIRGIRGGAAGAAVIDSDGGGAGLGLHRSFDASAVTIFEVQPGSTTSVICLFELDTRAKDLRATIPSVHYFQR